MTCLLLIIAFLMLMILSVLAGIMSAAKVILKRDDLEGNSQSERPTA